MPQHGGLTFALTHKAESCRVQIRKRKFLSPSPITIKEGSEMTTEKPDSRVEIKAKAKKVLDEAWDRAQKVYEVAKKQADIVYKEAKKLAVDKQAKEEVDKTYQEAIKQAEKVRDAITRELQGVFIAAWDQSEKEYTEAITKLKERTDRVQKAYEEAKKQADIVYEEAKKRAVDKKAKKEAAKAHKEAIKQAEKDYREAKTKLQ
jgi:hypothetical protein